MESIKCRAFARSTYRGCRRRAVIDGFCTQHKWQLSGKERSDRRKTKRALTDAVVRAAEAWLEELEETGVGSSGYANPKVAEEALIEAIREVQYRKLAPRTR